MACRTRSTRRIFKLVSAMCAQSLTSSDAVELDALGLDDEPIGEGEMPSYLNDATALPDFIDAAPVEESQVSSREWARVVTDATQQANAPTAEVAR